jgi:GntR family transcriptional regulator/MocR family aminotransferase
MPKQAPPLALMLPPREPGVSLHLWLCGALRAAVLEGQLRPGARFPASRELARRYGLSRGTIVSAFEQLKAEGYVNGNVGSGTYVSRVLPDQLLQVARRGAARPPGRAHSPRRLSGFARRVSLFPASEPPPIRAFRANQPALDLFPTALWAQLTARRIRRASMNLLLRCDPMGYGPLQDAVADYLRTSRGVNCIAEQVAIVSGVQEALDLVARLFLDPGDRVAMEDPGYVGATLVFEAAGAAIRPVPVDDEGLDLERGQLDGVRLVYVTPAHQYPLGVTMTLRRRLALLEWARMSGALILEDDYDAEFRFSGRPVPALQGLDRRGVVLFAGSFSKVIFPSLRLGYLVVPLDLIDRLRATISVRSWHAPLLNQAVLCDFLAEGHFGRHIRNMREIYAERRGVLLEHARSRLGGLLEISGVEAGLQTAGLLQSGIGAQAARMAAAARDVEVIPLSYRHEPAEYQGLLLGFAAVDAGEIQRGVGELARALEGLMPGRRRRSSAQAGVQ